MQAKTVRTLSITFFILLFFWGVYSMLSYLGTPVHGGVLMTQAGNQMVAGACAAGDMLCRGLYSFFPSVIHTIGRAAPFFWYALLSLAAYGLYAGWQWLQNGTGSFVVRWKPWKLYALFLASLWLIFTTLSYGSTEGRPVRMFFEPIPQIYNVSPKGLEVLQQDYQDLDARGCLSQLPGEASGARIYTLREWCVQGSFITRVLTQVLFVTVLLFEFLILGSFLLGLLKMRFERRMIEALVAAGLGTCAWIAILWFAAVFGVYWMELGWGLAVLVPIVCYKEILRWGRRFLQDEWVVEYRWHDVSLLLGWLLLSYIALNFLTVVRPFPIGWDDLGSYLNRPRLLVSYGHFIYSMSPFGWEYLTSLGFLLFGYQSIFGATASMMVNWSAGLLALLGVFAFANTYLGKRRGLLAALLYYSMPLVGHFSFADMKIDNAVFFAGTLATLLLFLPLFPAEGGAEAGAEEWTDAEPSSQPPIGLGGWRSALMSLVAHFSRKPGAGAAYSSIMTAERWKYLLLAGLFGGFAFSFKSTAVMLVLPLVAILLGVLLDWTAALAAVFFGTLVLMLFGGFSLSTIIFRIAGDTAQTQFATGIFIALCLLAGLSLLLFAAYRARARLTAFLCGLGVFIAGFAIAVLPWIEHNNLLYGRVIPRVELGAPNTLSPTMAFRGTGGVVNVGQTIKTLPKELAMKPDAPACNATGSTEELDRYWGFSHGWLHYLTLPWRTVMNIDSAGYYVTTIPALLLFPLLLLLPYFWTKKARWLRWMFFGTCFTIVEWVFLANGVPWYGLAMFLGLTVGLETMVARAPDAPSRWLASLLLALSILFAFGMRFWQYEQTQNILEYSYGKVTADVLKQLTIPYYDRVTDIAVSRHNAMPDRPYLYRVGTFIPYFIPKNLEVIGLNDQQLDAFNCLYAERDSQLTLKRLKALGFNSIIFDTNTATIEQDPNGSLHKKVQAFQDFVNNPALKLQVDISDTAAGVAFVEIP